MAANKKDISALAGAMDEVEVAIRAVRERLSVDGLLDICTIAAPSAAGRQLLCGFDKRDASCLWHAAQVFLGGFCSKASSPSKASALPEGQWWRWASCARMRRAIAPMPKSQASSVTSASM